MFIIGPEYFRPKIEHSYNIQVIFVPTGQARVYLGVMILIQRALLGEEVRE